MHRARQIGFFALLIGCLILSPTITQSQRDSVPINLSHLRFLTEPVTISDHPMALVHIYSEYPNYKWVDAAGEGISAVDDVARAAVVYLWQYERMHDVALLDLAGRCLEFIRYMQAPDGEFYNFVLDRRGTINQTGNTSYKSLDWWAMRALWALGEGVRVFDTIDKDHADVLAHSYLLTETALANSIRNYGQYTELHGFKIPAWLPNGAADSSAVGLLGLVAFYRARPNPVTADLITEITDGIAAYRLGDHNTYPFGMHPVSDRAPGYWHDWGAHMVHALAAAGMALKHQAWIDSAAADAESFLLRQLAFERFRDMGNLPNRLGQIAYGTNMIVQAYMALYWATGQDRYARYAGYAASWLFGDNMADVPMYDPATGRTYDGIAGPASWRVNQNSGAESTIEGLMSLIAVADVPQAVRYLYVTPLSGTDWQIFEAEDGQRVAGQATYYHVDWTGEGLVSGGRYVGLGRGNAMQLSFDLPTEDDYMFYVSHVRQVAQKSSQSARAVRLAAPPTIDGDLTEWQAIPALVSNSREQFLRGSGLWQGPDRDSHQLQVAWDTDNLYLGVTVRDPEHIQRYTLSDVWHDDAFWVYLTSGKDANGLSAKFTLAQTPNGPQVWDWKHSGFLAGARLAWHAMDGGYVYEAAIPWASVGITDVKTDKIIGIEGGRGIGGNSFMDLTGRDPDIATNLLPLTLTDVSASAAEANPPPAPVFLQIQLDASVPVLLAESVSPDRDYFWLDKIWRDPVHLTEGTHTLRYAYAGAADDGSSKIDAFFVQPAIARKVFRLADSTTVTLVYNTLTGEASLTESPS